MKIQKLWFADEKIFIRTDSGQELWQSLLWYPRLKRATVEQRMKYEYDETGFAPFRVSALEAGNMASDFDCKISVLKKQRGTQ
ncbi:MAG: DUF2442 domain-containing protein [Dysgonamonadaceae bacterium]|jgi:hypothetical protein|nr:DUF2442 domain-containing protein [Dysgonamonadaceae bacterium]